MPGIGLEVGFVVFWCSGVAQAGPGQDVGGILRSLPQEATASCRPQEDQAASLNLNLG
jgi:hypothetical protein